MEEKFCFAIDRGGTFTDVYARCPGGKIRVLKLLSVDPQNYKDAPTEGIRRIVESVSMWLGVGLFFSFSSFLFFRHGLQLISFESRRWIGQTYFLGDLKMVVQFLVCCYASVTYSELVILVDPQRQPRLTCGCYHKNAVFNDFALYFALRSLLYYE